MKTEILVFEFIFKKKLLIFVGLLSIIVNCRNWMQVLECFKYEGIQTKFGVKCSQKYNLPGLNKFFLTEIVLNLACFSSWLIITGLLNSLGEPSLHSAFSNWVYVLLIFLLLKTIPFIPIDAFLSSGLLTSPPFGLICQDFGSF